MTIYHLLSGNFVNSPGVMRIAQAEHKHRPDWAVELLVAGFSLPEPAARAVLTGAVPYTVEGNMVTIDDGGAELMDVTLELIGKLLRDMQDDLRVMKDNLASVREDITVLTAMAMRSEGKLDRLEAHMHRFNDRLRKLESTNDA